MIISNLKKIFLNIKNNFALGGHVISFGGVGIALTFILLIEKIVLLSPLVVIYLLAITALLYNRYKERETDFPIHPERTKFLQKYFKWTIFIMLLSLVVSLIILFKNDKIYSLLFIVFWYSLMILYTLYFKKLTSRLIGFKNIYFSLIIASLIIFISFYYSYNFLNIAFLIIFIFIFLRIFVNNIFLDIKDIENDKKYNLKTFPIVFGGKKTISFLKIISLLSGIVLILGILFGLIPTYSLILLVFIPYNFYYFKKSTKKENFYLVNYILADAEFILWPISIIIGKTIL